MTPPSIGPNRLETANTELMMPEYIAAVSTVSSLRMATKVREYRPDAPIPWNARKTML